MRSRPGKGSVFAIEVKRVIGEADTRIEPPSRSSEPKVRGETNGTVLVVEDDPDIRNLLQLLVEADGHRTTIAADGPEALSTLAETTPHLILADYNLPQE